MSYQVLDGNATPRVWGAGNWDCQGVSEPATKGEVEVEAAVWFAVEALSFTRVGISLALRAARACKILIAT